MILRHLKQNALKTFFITLLIIIVTSIIFITGQSLNYVEIEKLPFYLKAYTYLILPISNDYRYLFIFTTLHIYSFLFIYMIFLFYEMRKKTPIEKFLPISLNKYLIKKYVAIVIEILFIISIMFILLIIYSYIYYSKYYPVITYTYITSISFVLISSIIDYFIFKHQIYI